VSRFLQACAARRNLRRALITSAIVGPILSLINQTGIVLGFFRGELPAGMPLLRIALTFVVPFVVSLVSAAMADARRSAED
jgi:hypothetical protein